MYICVCHALTDSDIATAESQGARNECEVFQHYGVASQCGSCTLTMRSIMKLPQDAFPNEVLLSPCLSKVEGTQDPKIS